MPRSLKFGIILCIGVVIFGISTLFYGRRAPELQNYDHLIDPQIRTMSSQRVLVIQSEGDPSKTTAASFGTLYRSYFKIPKRERSKGPAAPRARWQIQAETIHAQSQKMIGLPVGDAITEVPGLTPEERSLISIQTWEYGLVAEILHKGAYSTERADIDRLLEYVASLGYEPLGEHEEEYLRGPGIMSPGDPQKYMTILRYRIRAKE